MHFQVLFMPGILVCFKERSVIWCVSTYNESNCLQCCVSYSRSCFSSSPKVTKPLVRTQFQHVSPSGWFWHIISGRNSAIRLNYRPESNVLPFLPGCSVILHFLLCYMVFYELLCQVFHVFTGECLSIIYAKVQRKEISISETFTNSTEIFCFVHVGLCKLLCTTLLKD